jgi:aspartate 4-decarboxylase
MEHPAGIGGMPQAKGIAGRFESWLAKHSDMPGASFLSSMLVFATQTFKFEPDAFVHELVDSIIGDNYPVPDRMLVHNERIVNEYLMGAMCGQPRPAGKFEIYAVEGGTAAMCYIFKSLKANRLLHPGDTIALGTPIFTPYVEMTHLEDYALNVVQIAAPQENRFQFTDAEIKKLEDPEIKAFFVVNPGNPTGMALNKETIGKIANLVKTKRPDLMLLTDDVYGTFVHDFRSLLGELPQNTIGVYSYSKYFGCTGWRLGVIAIHEDNIFDKMIAKLPAADLKALDTRYGALTLKPREVKFIDRIVADSRDVALNHTAGLSLPQQVMMTLFSLSEMMDSEKRYQAACMDIVSKRFWTMVEGLGLKLDPNANYDAYYGLVDFEFWARKNIGADAVEYLKKNVHPLDLAFRLAEDHGIVLLNGGGFEAPDWSLRASLANLPDEAYESIARGVRTIARGYRDAYESSRKVQKV